MQNRINILLQERCFESASLPLKVIDVLAFSVVTLFAILARISLFPYASNEYSLYTEVWFNTIRDSGGIFGIGASVGTATPPYLYLLALLSYLPISPLFSIKIVSCIFDILIAFTVFRILMGVVKSVKVSLCGYAAILLSPTLMLNSAAWGAYDSIFVCLILFCLFAFMKNRPFQGTFFFALAIAIKLQAIFFAPVLIVMWLKNRTRLKYFLIIPLVYIVAIIPAFLGGRSLFELMILYIRTATSSVKLSNNAPNLFFLMGDISYDYVAIMGIFICISVVMIELYLLYTKIFRFVPTSVITISLLFALTIPYLLPYMNPRHFYLAEIFSIILAFCRPSIWYVAALINGASLVAYMPDLFGATDINLFYPFVMMTAGVVLVIMDLALQIRLNGAKVVKNARQTRAEPEPAYAQAPPQPRVRQAPAPEPYTPAAAAARPTPPPAMDDEFDDDDYYRNSKSPFPSSAYSLSPEALAKKIPSIADVIEVKPDPIQQLQMQQMQVPTQSTPSPQVVSASMYEQAQPPVQPQPQAQPFVQPPPQANPFVQAQAQANPFAQQNSDEHQPQFPLTTSERLASDKSPPFTLSQKIPRTDGPPPPPPPPAEAAIVPKPSTVEAAKNELEKILIQRAELTKSEMIAQQMEQPRRPRPIPKQYLEQNKRDNADFIEQSYDEFN